MSRTLLLLITAELPGFFHLSDVDLERFLISAGHRWTSSAKTKWTLDDSVNGLVTLDAHDAAPFPAIHVNSAALMALSPASST